ncbi:MAG: MerC domain-containing protein, partial [Bacteroidetes bacterium]|nr:MerC domain-containing protein [Bacteroidota bacterium]
MENHKHSANKISIYLSLLCAIHCLAMPVVIAIIPFASFFLEKYHWLE